MGPLSLAFLLCFSFALQTLCCGLLTKYALVRFNPLELDFDHGALRSKLNSLVTFPASQIEFITLKLCYNILQTRWNRDIHHDTSHFPVYPVSVLAHDAATLDILKANKYNIPAGPCRPPPCGID